MKAITIRQPYASLLIRGVKEWEYRTWKLPVGTPIAVHAGRALSQPADVEAVCELLAGGVDEETAARWISGLPRGRILGVIACVGHEPARAQQRLAKPARRGFAR